MNQPIWFRVLIAIGATLLLLAPAAKNAYETMWRSPWEHSPRFDGIRYVIDEPSSEHARGDRTRAAAVLSRLHRWQGRTRPVDEVLADLEADGYPDSLGAVRERMAEAGFEGQWVEGGLAALVRFKKPLIADTQHEGGSLLIVRRVRDGYVYATSPGVGDVLYRMEDFDRVWTGRALVFPDPPEQPQEWR